MQVFLTELLQLTTVLTLSISEAVLLLKMAVSSYEKPEIRTLDDLIHLTEALYSLGPEYVLLKGDQLPLTGNLEVPRDDSDRQIVVNFLYDGTDVSLIKTAYTVPNTPRRSRYALACMLSTSENMILPTKNCSQLQSLRISPLETPRCQPLKRLADTSKLQ